MRVAPNLVARVAWRYRAVQPRGCNSCITEPPPQAGTQIQRVGPPRSFLKPSRYQELHSPNTVRIAEGSRQQQPPLLEPALLQLPSGVGRMTASLPCQNRGILARGALGSNAATRLMPPPLFPNSARPNGSALNGETRSSNDPHLPKQPDRKVLHHLRRVRLALVLCAPV